MAVDDRLSDLLVEWEQGRRNGIEPSLEDLCRETPDLLPMVRESINSLRATDWMFHPDANDSAASDSASEAARAALHDTELPASHLTVQEFAASIFQSGLLSRAEINELKERLDASALPGEAREIASRLVTEGKLTRYQAAVLLKASKDPLLVDNYVILDTLDTGGMGLVFKALHRSMNRVVALKLLPASMMSARDTVKRFQREVQAAAALKHPNVVAAYDADESTEIAYLVLEYVEGTNLYRLVREQGPCTLSQGADYVRQAATGLAYLHSRGIIHRDVKPANLILANDGTVKLLDMGLVRFASSEDLSCAEMDQDLTQAGIVIGTVAYMSPEQALDTRSADQRSDIYSLGCTLFFLLTGRSLYHEETGMKTLLAHREQPVPSIREFCEEAPVSLDAVFRTMVAKRPADRLQSMDEVIAALDACVPPPAAPAGRAGRPVPNAPPLRTGTNRSRVWQSRRFRIGAAVTALAAALLGSIYLAVIVIRIKTAQGTTEVNVNDPNAKIQITTQPSGSAPSQPQPPATAIPPGGLRVGGGADLFSGIRPEAKPRPPVPVVTATVRKGDFDDYLPDLQGMVRASQTVTVQSLVDGEITKVNFTEGQFVHEGDALFEIDGRPYKIRLDEGRAKLAKDEQLLADAQKEQQQAVKTAAVPVGHKVATVARYQNLVKTDTAQVEEAKLQLSRCRIAAPISGRIGLRVLDKGNMVQAANTTRLATIAQFQPVDILFYIPQEQIERVQQKLNSTKEATVEIWNRNRDAKVATAQIVGLDNTVNPTNGSIEVKARAANEDNRLFPGEHVNLQFLLNTLHDAVIVPTAAVQHGDAKSTFAFVVTPDQTVEKRLLLTGPGKKDQTVVTRGLSPGDIVVVQGTDKLADGTKVEVPNAGAPETVNPPRAPDGTKMMSIHFRNAPWTVVLAQFAKDTNLTLSLQSIPPGVLNRWDSGQYSRGQTLAILNGELARAGCHLHVEGNVLYCTALRPVPARLVNPTTDMKAPSSNAPPPPGSSDRIWAEWLLSHVSGCTLRTDLDPESVLFIVNDLPPIEFHITRIGFTAQPTLYRMPLDATLVQGLNELPALEAISFNPIPKTLVPALTSLTRVKSLSLQSATELGEGPLKTIGDDSLNTIGRMTSLEALRIESNQITDTGLKNLAGLTRLTELVLSKARHVHGSGLRVLSALKLRVLGLPDSGIDDAGLAETARFPTLEEVNLSGTWISPKGLAPLAGLANLKQLDLDGCRRIDDSAFAELEKLKHLRILNLLNTRVTSDLIVELRSRLPDCSIALPTQARKRTMQQQRATPKSR